MSQEQKEVHGSADSVRHRLLDAAEKLFCEKGFDSTSVRDLTSEANCNVAAVNYYFGGKDKLYLEMFRRQMQAIVELQSETIERHLSSPNPNLEDFIRAVVTPPLRSAYEKQTRGQVMRLMVREVLSKSDSGEKICDDFRTQMMEKMVAALMRLIPELDLQRAKLAFSSIESLNLHPFLFMEHYFRMIEGLTFERLIDHIVGFASAGIRNLLK
jgi:TetR/AcrR family transcriptional regulator, regulator of cefoperazone and chloramphenicol sensitivity